MICTWNTFPFFLSLGSLQDLLRYDDDTNEELLTKGEIAIGCMVPFIGANEYDSSISYSWVIIKIIYR